MSDTRVCPGCNGSKRTKRIGRFSMPCGLCTGSGRVSEADYDRFCKMLGIKPDCEQMNIFTEEGDKNAL